MSDENKKEPKNDSANYDPYDFNTKWANIDVHLTYQFDNEPTNIVQVGSSYRGGTGGKDANGYYNDLYQVSFRLQNKQLKSWQSWMNWFEKIQPDYKFLVVDEKNAQTVVFQNVDDPWMFTQYIYKGIGKIYDPYSDSDNKSVKKNYLIIQPGLYDINGEPLNQAAKDITKQLGYNYEQDDEQLPKSYKKVRQKGWYKPQYGEYQHERYTTGADGSILYRGEICVQCIKWGQHGNVPAHAVNMIAPKQYVQGDTKLVLRAIKKTTYGIPVYVDQFGNGYIYKGEDGKYYVIDNIGAPVSLVSSSSSGSNSSFSSKLATVEYTVPTSGGTQISKNFTKTTSPKIECRLIGIDIDGGQVAYQNGCKYFGVVGSKSGSSSSSKIIGCTLQKNMTEQQKKYAKCSNGCKTGNKECKYFVKRGKTIAYRYQCLPTNYRDYNDSQMRNLLMYAATVGGVAGGQMAIEIAAGLKNDQEYKQVGGFSRTTQTTYEYVQQPLNGIQVDMPQYTQNNKGAKIIRGTGQSAFQKPGLKVRTIYDGDMSQINYHRWLNKILPCYNKKFCNQTVGPNESKQPPIFANSGCSYMDINQQNQIINKTVSFCPYYTQINKNGIGCPYATVNKTAMDFAKINNAFYNSFYFSAISIGNYFLNKMRKEQSVEGLKYTSGNIYAQIVSNELQQGSGKLVIHVYYSFYELKSGQITSAKNFVSSKQAIVELSKTFGLQQEVLQKSKKSQADDSDFFLCTIKLQAANFEIQKKQTYYVPNDEESKQTQILLDCFIKYNAYSLGQYSESGASKPQLLAQWIVKVEKCQLPFRDPTIIDNQIKFLGGYHPQYSAYPASPEQILYKKETPYNQQFSVASKADESQFGSAVVGTVKQVQYGYFVQENGNWILDGREIGQPIGDVADTVDGRAQNPTANCNGGIAIGGTWQNSIIDPQSPQPRTKRIKKCLFYTNDTTETIQSLRDKPPQVIEQGQDKPRKVPVNIFDTQALPLSRQFAYCGNCDTVLALRFLSISSSPTDQTAQNGNMKCPWCGNGFTRVGKGAAKRVPRTKAMGRVVVWGLPGTIVKTDSYFWKSPTMVNNALVQQIRFKLGSPSTVGGGYSFSNNSGQSEKIDSVPFFQQVGKYSKGIPSAWYKLYGLTKQSQSSSESSTSNSSTNKAFQYWYNNPNRIMTNPSLPANILQTVGIDATIDNRIINPFDGQTLSSLSGLPMVSLDYITSLRNRVQPVLGYCVGRKDARGGQLVLATGEFLSTKHHLPEEPGQYQMYRVKYDDRKQLSHLKYWVKKRCACQSLLLAYAGESSNQTSCKVSYPSGDRDIGDFVKYYPPDPKWWFKKQYVGGISLTKSGNPFHFDQQDFFYDVHNMYGGLKDVSAQCYILPHGFIPLDKQVVAAYLYYSAFQKDCYQPSIGQVQFPSGRKKICYLHFHPYTTQHQGYGLKEDGSYDPHKHQIDNNLVYEKDEYDFNNPEDLQRFKKQRNIIDNDDIGPNADIDITKHKLISYFDKYGDKYYIDQKTGLPIFYRLFKKKHPQYFIQTQDIHQFKWMEDNLPYSPLAAKTNMALNANGLNYTHQSKDYGTAPLPNCIRWDGFGTDIIQTKSQNQIWKNYTKQQFQKMEDRYLSHVKVQIDIGGGNVTYFSFDQYYDKFNGVLQQEMQSIPGYFDFSSFNNSGYLKKYQNKSSKSTSIQGNYQQFIVTQAETNGASDSENAGNGDYVKDITDQFKLVYNERVDRQYTGQLSKKSIKDTLQSSYTSKWKGVKGQSKQSQTWSANFNNRLKESGYYVLNTNYWYPKLNQDGVPQVSINGQKMQFNISKLLISKKTKTLYTLTSVGATVSVTCTIGAYTPATKEFTHSKVNYIDSKTLVSYMNQAVKATNCKSVVVQQNRGNITISINPIVKDQKNVYPNVSFNISGVEAPPTFDDAVEDCNRVIAYSGFKNGYHPKYLTHFKKPGSGLPNPKYQKWQNITLNQQPQYVIFDLIQPPFEKQRRDYLSDRGSVSYKSSKCKNAECPAYNQIQQMYAKMRNRTAGSTCLGCGLQLEPVTTDCDGINSWWYYKQPQNDVVIAGLKIQAVSNSSTTPLNPISVFVSSDNKQWQCILSLNVVSNGGSKTHNYNNIYLTQNTTKTAIQPYSGKIDFLDYTGSNENSHGKLIRGRYLKVVSIPQPYEVKCQANGYSFGSNYIQFKKQDIEKLYVSDGELKDQKVQMFLTQTHDDGKKTTVKLVKVVRNNEGNKIYIDPIKQTPNSQISKILMTVVLYYSGIESINIYGGGYSAYDGRISLDSSDESPLIITPPPNRIYGEYNYQIPINIIPLQFFKVGVCIYDYQQIPLEQILEYDLIQQVGFQLQTVSETLYVNDLDDNGDLKSANPIQKQIYYYQIKNGKFYFDVGKKRLIMPRYGFANSFILQKPFGNVGASTGQLRSVDQFQKTTYNGEEAYKIPIKDFGANLQKWGKYKQLYPTHYSVTMWDGTQGGVQISVRAKGSGPSYQVERGAICQISNMGELPKSGETTPLPINPTQQYSSYEQINRSTQKLTQVPWIVYNRQLATLPQKSSAYQMNRGNFIMNLSGTQLYGNNADYWRDNIIGKECEEFIGTVQTSVVLKGKPNTCLYLPDGQKLVVKAPKIKTRWIGNQKVTQRTGGLVKGVRVATGVELKNGTGRAANAYDVPYIVVYLKQRYVDDSPIE